MSKNWIRVIATKDGMFEIYRGETLYGIASTLEEMRQVQQEAKQQR